MPHTCRSQYRSGPAQLGGNRALGTVPTPDSTMILSGSTAQKKGLRLSSVSATKRLSGGRGQLVSTNLINPAFCDGVWGGHDAHPILVCIWRRSVSNHR